VRIPSVLRQIQRGLGPTVLSVALIGVGGCTSDAERGAPTNTEQTADTGRQGTPPPTVFERNLVLMTMAGDSAIIVPWLFRTETNVDGALREVGAWLSRGDTWEPFYFERWRTGPTRAPFRIHPRGPLDLVIGNEDALEAVLYEEGSRKLETVLDEPLTDWRGVQGTTFRIHRGALFLSDRRLEARVVDMSRSRRSDQPAVGDWMYLQAGPELSLVLEAPVAEPTGEVPYTGWALMGDEQLEWSNVQVKWSELRDYEEARRNIPASWNIRSADGQLTGTLSSTASYLQVVASDGPLLPVQGLFRVQGRLTIAGDSIEVRGMVRHIQP
jgi:hypothetical protein